MTPQNNTDGGHTGGNIRQAFMVDTSRVSFAGVADGALDAVTATASVSGQIVLNLGAGRIAPRARHLATAASRWSPSSRST